MCQVEITFNERWSCTYYKKLKEYIQSEFILEDEGKSIIGAYHYPFPHIIDEVFCTFTVQQLDMTEIWWWQKYQQLTAMDCLLGILPSATYDKYFGCVVSWCLPVH